MTHENTQHGWVANMKSTPPSAKSGKCLSGHPPHQEDMVDFMFATHAVATTSNEHDIMARMPN
eukprot:gene1410-12544_t